MVMGTTKHKKMITSEYKLWAIQKICVKLEGREESGNLKQNVTVGNVGGLAI
jgi:hypothetical protein